MRYYHPDHNIYLKNEKLYSASTDKPLNRRLTPNGIPVTVPKKDQAHNKFEYEHRLKIECYHNKVLAYEEVVDHINRVNYDNRLENLRIVTRSDNGKNQTRDFIDAKAYMTPYGEFTSFLQIVDAADDTTLHIGPIQYLLLSSKHPDWYIIKKEPK